ncbi:uncharacterized protein LOC62_02G003073 [Vanrija pseudolonga]|uniref:Amidohydrolase-related domain-containing protein n=1 Tax=Vanrija pseudolonga TaxID=143232 RepID=A0AAF0Y3I9_9TREE|nr:hypothetical protein LOC62_02G003073 [Vanrija pseudolonga]
MSPHAQLVHRRAVDVEKNAQVSDDLAEDDKQRRRKSPSLFRVLAALALVGVTAFYYTASRAWPWDPQPPSDLPPFIREGIKQCEIIGRPPPNPAPATRERTTSDRFVPGTGAVWLKNATVWTGNNKGHEVLYEVDVLLDGGVIRRIGSSEDVRDEAIDADEVDLNGAWLTPGLVDVHSHIGVEAAPALNGGQDGNSIKGSVRPFLRSLDGFNTHDASFNLSIAGGITTMLVLPGSAGNIGGQAFTFKPRWTAENTPASMQVEPPFRIENGSWERTRAWRHIKHACGENPARVYGNVRMESAYAFREAYTNGKALKDIQDAWCEDPRAQSTPFPQDLEWEALADVLRGNVKVNVHCYETVDIDDFVRITNEFQFPVAAFHHAHEAYLVPGVIKQAYGPEPPAVAIFANFARYKREAYRLSPYAAKVLNDAGIKVSFKSDHPAIDSRYLVFEAQQGHAFGLPWAEALASVTTVSAHTAGLDHRLGYVREGYDADVVVWDSFPLALGATPKQTYIDGIPQLVSPHVGNKPAEAQEITTHGDYAKEAAADVVSRGDPDLRPRKQASKVVFEHVKEVYLGEPFVNTINPGRVVVSDGEVVCIGRECVVAEDAAHVDLKNGTVTRGLITAGSRLGHEEIDMEASTGDGLVYDALAVNSDLLSGVLVHGVDGAQFGTKGALMAYREGITTGVSWPGALGPARFIAGVSFSFSTSAPHPLAPGAIGTARAALHLNLDDEGADNNPSISTKLSVLRRLLRQKSVVEDNELGQAFVDAAEGKLRLVVNANSADHIGALVRIKRDVAPALKLTIFGGAEAYMLADELARNHIGVVVAPGRAFPYEWTSRRFLPGPPLSNLTLPALLHKHGVKVGLGLAGIVASSSTRLTRFEAAWAYANAPHVFSKRDAIALVTTNLEELLGLNDGAEVASSGIVAYEGDFFSLHARVRGVVGPGGGAMHLL